MRITIESTTKIVHVNGVPARIWEGLTDGNIPVHCFVTRVAVPQGLDHSQYADFERDLQEHTPPSPAIQAIDLRMVL